MAHAFKKRIAIPAVLAAALIGLGSAAEVQAAGGMGLTFKLSGGAGYLLNGAGDLELVRLGYQSYAADWVEPTYTSTFDWKKLSILPDVRFEVLLRFGDRFGLGLGTGYLGFNSRGAYSLDHDATGSEWWGDWEYRYTDEYNVGFKLTAIPVSLNIYYFLPTDGMSLYVYGGPSVYFGSLTHTWDEAYDVAYSDSSSIYWDQAYTRVGTETYNEKTTATAFGFQGGFGLEIPLSPNFSFGLEAYGRYVNFANWQGDWTYSGTETYEEYYEPWGWWYSDSFSWSDQGSGSLFYDEWLWNYTGKYYGEAWVYDSAPSGSGVRNVRKAGINLNSFGILASILIHI